MRYAYNRIVNAEAIAEQAKQLSQEQTEKASTLQTNLNISLENAKNLADALAAIRNGTTKPSDTFYVTAPTVQIAADQLTKRINDYDTTLPAAALEKTDRTVVTPITKDSNGNVLPADQQKVDVYKINLDKPHGIGVYVSTESIGAMVQNKNVIVFGGPKYKNGGYEVGAAWMKRF